MDLIPAASQEKLKSYWNRPGGKFGTVMGLAALGAALYYGLPILNTIVWEGLNLVWGGLALMGTLWVVFNPKLRRNLFYLWEIAMKKLAGVVIQLDPFIIAEDDIKDMKERREEFDLQVQAASAEEERIAAKILEKEKEQKRELNIAEAARQKATQAQTAGDVGAANKHQMAMTVATRQVGRLKDSIAALIPIRNDLNRLSNHLNKVYTNSAYFIQDAENELATKKDLYYAVTRGSKAVNAALALFKGDPEKKLLAEQSMEYLKEDIAGKLASMKRALAVTGNISERIDLENATFEQEGLALLEQLSDVRCFQLGSPNVEAAPAMVPAAAAQASHHSSLLND